ncbi:hypothetical protein ACH3XW_25290 [Acanthocheilonema viteae]
MLDGTLVPNPINSSAAVQQKTNRLPRPNIEENTKFEKWKREGVTSITSGQLNNNETPLHPHQLNITLTSTDSANYCIAETSNLSTNEKKSKHLTDKSSVK